MAKCGLEKHFSELTKSLPVDEDSSILFCENSIPMSPGTLSTANLVIKKGTHFYGTFRVDYPQWYAEKQTYCHLGLAILSTVFHRKLARVQITLEHPATEINHLIVEREHPTHETITGYSTEPYAFCYYPNTPLRHPWSDIGVPSKDMPFFSLTNLEDCVGVTDEEMNARDTIRGLGSDVGAVRFAELLLDISRVGQSGTEFPLEAEPGFRGVAPGSAQIRLWLPGGDGWEDYWAA